MSDMEAVKAGALVILECLKADSTCSADHYLIAQTIRALLAENERLEKQAEAALTAAQKRIAVHEEWEQGHREAHERAVNDCPHDEKTWTCCATCHCVAMQKLVAANERAEKLLEIAMDCAPTRTIEALRPAAQGHRHSPDCGHVGQGDISSWLDAREKEK